MGAKVEKSPKLVAKGVRNAKRTGKRVANRPRIDRGNEGGDRVEARVKVESRFRDDKTDDETFFATFENATIRSDVVRVGGRLKRRHCVAKFAGRNAENGLQKRGAAVVRYLSRQGTKRWNANAEDNVDAG